MTASGGRPAGPTDETRERVLQAAFRLLVTDGPAGLTPVKLHRETGVARTTIYRHWPNPAAIVGDILAGAVARWELDDLVGDVVEDLPIAVATLTFRFEHRPVADFYRATLHHGGDDPETGDGDVDDEVIAGPSDHHAPLPAMSRRYIEGLLAPVADVVAAAIDRGQLAAEPSAVPALTSELCGPLLLDHLLLGKPVDHEAVAARVRAFLDRHLSAADAEPTPDETGR
ncbi:MAG: TetR/AcrR family transcriptional regulator [Actinomycetota bacterium]